MNILGLDESLKRLTGPTRPDPTVILFDGWFIGNFKRKGREILTQSILKSSICVIKIWDRYI